jgi:thioredoxin 1
MADVIITDSNFKSLVLESKDSVVVDFWAPWCGPCKVVGPIIEELAKEYDGKVTIGKLNVDENSETTAKYNVMSIPTIIFFKNGKPVHSTVGAQGKESYKKIIDGLLGS